MTLLDRLVDRIGRWVLGIAAEKVEQALGPKEEPMPLTHKSVQHQQAQIAEATSPRAITTRHTILPPPRKPRR